MENIKEIKIWNTHYQGKSRGRMVAMGDGQETVKEIAKLLELASAADRDANSEFPDSYYRKAHRARARRLRAKATKLHQKLLEGDAR